VNSAPLSAIFFALFGFALFSLHDAGVKTLGSTYSVIQISFFIILFSFVPLSVLIAGERRMENFRPRHPWLVGMRCVCNMASMMLVFYAFTALPLSDAYALVFTAPVILTILAIPFLGERVRLARWTAVLIALCGVTIVVRPGFAEITLGHIAAFASAWLVATSAIIMRKVGPDERPITMIMYPLIFNVVVLGALLPFFYKPMAIEHLAMLAGMSVLSVIGQVCVLKAYSGAPAVVIAPLQYTQILWGVGFSAAFFGTIADMWVLSGSSIIICSGLFILWRESRHGSAGSTRPNLRGRIMRPDHGPVANSHPIREHQP
jgi:drug/metabolite transporter (DMT)-like permease